MYYYYLCTLGIFVVTYIFIKLYQQSRYFSQWGVPECKSIPFFGVALAIFYPKRRHINNVMKWVYDYNREAKYVGAYVFGSPVVYIRDLELVKIVLVKNFESFADRKTFVDENTDPLFGTNLNFLNGDRWKEVRNTLSPAFTSSKMRAMYTLMSECAENFSKQFIKLYGEKDDGVDVKDVFSRYTNDVIATCAFGFELDSLNNPDNEFYKEAKSSTAFKGVTGLKILLEMMFPKLTRKFGLRIVSKKTTDFFVNVIKTSMEIRDEKGIVRPDMLQLMMEARSKMNQDTAAKFDILEMTAQAFLFFLAGFEANSTQASLIMHELAINPDIQNKVLSEVDAVMKSPTYEAISNNMPYLDAVFSESLRRHPIAFLNRICSKEFELPPALPDSKPFLMKPGMGLFVPVAGIHADPELYQDPDRFDPERFIDKKVNIADITNLGFGLGPRMCIGNRFAILAIKSLIVHLLAKCTFEPCQKTCVPMEYDPNVFAPVAKGGFWLKVKART